MVPRVNFEGKYNQTFALIQEHVSFGRHLLYYHQVPAEYDNINNAASPA